MSTEIKTFIGIDVSKNTLDISIKEKHKKIKNTKEAIGEYINSNIKGMAIGLCVVEATGGYERLAMVMFSEAGIPVHRAHPNKVHHFAKTTKYSAKTDKSDSRMIEKYAEFISKYKPVCKVVSSHQLEMQNLRSMQVSLREDLHAYKCRAKMLTGKPLEYANEQLEFIEKQRKKIQKDINQLVIKDEEMYRKQQILISHVGVAEKTANSLLAELPELGSLSNKEIASLVGVAPRTNESGKKVGKSHIRGGRFFARKTLYMSALVAAFKPGKMQKFYQSLIAKGKSGKVALVAVMRKMVVCLNSMIKNNKLYQENYEF